MGMEVRAAGGRGLGSCAGAPAARCPLPLPAAAASCMPLHAAACVGGWMIESKVNHLSELTTPHGSADTHLSCVDSPHATCTLPCRRAHSRACARACWHATRTCRAADPGVPVAVPRPRAAQDSSGISRDEMAEALMQVSEGKIPTDRIALRELCREMQQWPAMDEPTSEWE